MNIKFELAGLFSAIFEVLDTFDAMCLTTSNTGLPGISEDICFSIAHTDILTTTKAMATKKLELAEEMEEVKKSLNYMFTRGTEQGG